MGEATKAAAYAICQGGANKTVSVMISSDNGIHHRLSMDAACRLHSSLQDVLKKETSRKAKLPGQGIGAERPNVEAGHGVEVRALRNGKQYIFVKVPDAGNIGIRIPDIPAADDNDFVVRGPVHADTLAKHIKAALK